MMTTFTAPPLSLEARANPIAQHAPSTKQGPSAEDWERLRPVIKSLYIDEDRTLKDVMKIMADEHGHKATVKMYKLRFTKWEFDKHNRQADMAFAIRKKTARDAEGKRSMFVVRSKEVSAQEIDRYANRKRTLDTTFEEAPIDKATPIHILCFTPPDSPYPEEAQDTSVVLAQQNTFASNSATTSTRLGKRKRISSPNRATPYSLATHRDYRRIRAWAQSPNVPLLVRVPDALRRLEMLFADISSYVHGSVSNGTWYLDNKGWLKSLRRETVYPSDFMTLCIQATMYFKISLTVQGRRLLSKAFSLLPPLLRGEHPYLLEILMENLIKLKEEGFVGICAMVQNYIAELAKIILPEGHICRRICISICYSDTDHAELLIRSWRCLADAFAHVSGRFSYNSYVNEVNIVCRLYSPTDPQRAEKLLRGLLADYEQTTQKLDDTVLFVIYRLANFLYDQGRYADAELLVEDTLLRAREARYLSRFREARLMKSLAWAQYGLFKDDLAEESMLNAMALYVEAYGKSDPEVIGCCRALEGWLREWERDAEADQLLAEIDEMIGPDDIEIDAALIPLS